MKGSASASALNEGTERGSPKIFVPSIGAKRKVIAAITVPAPTQYFKHVRRDADSLLYSPAPTHSEIILIEPRFTPAHEAVTANAYTVIICEYRPITAFPAMTESLAEKNTPALLSKSAVKVRVRTSFT